MRVPEGSTRVLILAWFIHSESMVLCRKFYHNELQNLSLESRKFITILLEGLSTKQPAVLQTFIQGRLPVTNIWDFELLLSEAVTIRRNKYNEISPHFSYLQNMHYVYVFISFLLFEICENYFQTIFQAL